MLPWLDDAPDAQPVLQQMAHRIGSDWRARLSDPQWATANRVAQVLVTGTALAAWAAVARRVPVPVAVCGYSVGELAASAAAGLFDDGTALALADARAESMDRSVEGLATGLLAIHDMPLDDIRALCDSHGLAIAIRLGADRAIVGGLVSSLDAAKGRLAVDGRRCTPIDARIASHTPWMASAARAFAERLAAVPLRSAGPAVVCNFTGAATRAPRVVAQCLAGQIASTVLWDACMETLAERAVTCVLEVGPGTSLSALWRGRYPHVPARSVDEFRSAEAAGAWVIRSLAAASN
jgi:[acyl-carrier-protein] S-malonyltransferase